MSENQQINLSDILTLEKYFELRLKDYNIVSYLLPNGSIYVIVKNPNNALIFTRSYLDIEKFQELITDLLYQDNLNNKFFEQHEFCVKKPKYADEIELVK